MKNKNAFTLVELLAVIVILGILSSISVLAVINIKKNQDIENLGNMISGVLTGAKRYESDAPYNTEEITVDYLVNNGYADVDSYDYINEDTQISYEKCDENEIKRQFIIEVGNITFTDCGCDEQKLNEDSTKICLYNFPTSKDKIKNALSQILKSKTTN